mmetsp:Transcript_43561/g.105612  ORF Transcript_43561/g.105612 Transcript_43561/m.105612 type:complete len:607 (-) Transcript_43561:141-1961(-)|eukprot:CAMPEP_0113464200 /NCGR_PEP_ID=MMETSP0014_2-20120614/13075_1 /TAXON_ID=2857 /ORGANISM="Nitzschia sp." /LENGTH=606 /DNA_ID=CAMNT_0000356267 /DNA_START=737 /DNA_END=2557 /DNA_ORIENTATION=+ /assembly_acc=CAM_ASM_000159
MFIPRLIYNHGRRGRQESWSSAFDFELDIDFESDVEPSQRMNREGSSSFIPMEDEHVDDCYSPSTNIDNQTAPTSNSTSNASTGTTVVTSVQPSSNVSTGVGHGAAPAPAALSEDVKLPAPSMGLGGSEMTPKTPPRPSSAASSVLSGDGDSQKGLDQKAPPSMTSSSPVSVGKTASRPLPKDFVPNDYSVIVGRGKKVRQSAGNLHLRTLCSTYLSQYSDAMNNKPVKTEIVNSIISIIRAVCPDGGRGAFIKMKDGVWCEVSDRVAREKVGYVFRDLLHDRYESSAQSKAAKKNRRLSSTSSVHSRSSVPSRSSSTSSLVQHDRRASTTSSSSTTGKSSQKEDHVSSLSLFEPATVPSSQSLSGSGSGYAASFSSMSQQLPFPMQQQHQQQEQQQQLSYDQTMMSSMTFQMMPNLQHQQPQYTGSSMMGSFPQQMQPQQNFQFHQNQAAAAQNWNPQLSVGGGWGGGRQDHQQQQQRQQQQQHPQNLHSPTSYDHQQYRRQPDLPAGPASAAADMMMMMLEPSPIMSSSTAHIDPAPRRTSHTLSADDMAQLLLNSELGRGMEDVSSSSIIRGTGTGSRSGGGGNGGGEGSSNDDYDVSARKQI